MKHLRPYETSYRQLNQGRIKTSTRCLRLRYLYVAIALILRNVWVWLPWEVLSPPRRGRRRLNLQRLTLEGLLVILVHVAETLFGFRDRVIAERQPPATLATGTGQRPQLDLLKLHFADNFHKPGVPARD